MGSQVHSSKQSINFYFLKLKSLLTSLLVAPLRLIDSSFSRKDHLQPILQQMPIIGFS